MSEPRPSAGAFRAPVSAFALDHLVVVVPALAEAIAEFGDAGFTVTPGGCHDAIPTENALVAFADGSYLELLAFRDAATRDELRALAGTSAWERHLHGASAVARRFLPALATREGVADLVFVRGRLERFAAESRRRGVPMTGPVPMERRRPDGVTLAWELLLPADPSLPFFIEDRTERALRVPGGPPATVHTNGARGVAIVRVRTADVVATAMTWTDLLGARPRSERDGTTWLEVAGLAVELEEGAPAGACEVRLAGVGALPPAVRALGVGPER